MNDLNKAKQIIEERITKYEELMTIEIERQKELGCFLTDVQYLQGKISGLIEASLVIEEME